MTIFSNHLTQFGAPSYFEVQGVVVKPGVENDPGLRFTQRFSALWRLIPGSSKVWYLFDKQNKICFTYMDGELAAYPDITKEEFKESWGGDKALLHANAVYVKTHTPYYIEIVRLMARCGIEL